MAPSRLLPTRPIISCILISFYGSYCILGFEGSAMAPFRTVQEHIHPPEADPVAANFASGADEVDKLADAVELLQREIGTMWRGGGARQAFLSRLDPLPNELRSLAGNLRRMSEDIRHIQVIIEVQEPY